MIASIIGQQLLATLNAQSGEPDLNPEEFFVQKVWPMFYGQPQKTMMWVANSVFNSLENHERQQHNATRRQEVLEGFLLNLKKGNLHGGNAVGYPAGNKMDTSGKHVVEYATTSAQTNFRFPSNSYDNALLSWPGAGLGVGVSSGLCILFQDPYLQQVIYEGWGHYRHFLDTYPKLAPRQLESWNGHWLAHRLGNTYSEKNPLLGFNPMTKDQTTINRYEWHELLVKLARVMPQDSLVGYVYKLGQTNVTIGYIPINLAAIGSLQATYRQFYEATLTEEQPFEKVYIPERTFYSAVLNGAIGLDAFMSKGLKAYFGDVNTKPKPIRQLKEAGPAYAPNIAWLVTALGGDSQHVMAKANSVVALCLTHAGLNRRAKKSIETLLTLPSHDLVSDVFIDLHRESTPSGANRWNEVYTYLTTLSSAHRFYFLFLVRFLFASQPVKV